MHSESGQTRQGRQYKMWALLLATGIAGALLGYGRFMGDHRIYLHLVRADSSFLPAEWVMTIEAATLALMVAAAVKAQRPGLLLASGETVIWLAGACLLIGGLYRVPHYPRVVDLSDYGMLTRYLIKPSVSDLPKLLFAWPIFYGAIAVATSFMAVLRPTGLAIRWRWVVPALFLVCVTATPLALNSWPVKWDAESNWLMRFGVPGLALAAVAATLVFVGDSNRKLQWINLIAGLLLLRSFVPMSFAYIPVSLGGRSMTLGHVIYWMDQGYPILALGDLLLLVGSTTMLLTRKGGGMPIDGSTAPHTAVSTGAT